MLEEKQNFQAKKTILVVEDDVVLRNMLVSELKPMFNILEAGSGEKALKDILEKRPDAITLDLWLPSLDGLSLLAQLRSSPDPQVAQVKVVVLSNVSEQSSVEKAKVLGISAYIFKFNNSLSQLVEQVKNALKELIV